MADTVRTDRRRLERRASHRLFAGVAGGLADHTGARPIWFRLGFVVFTILGGLGLLIYLMLWWLMPRADEAESAAQRLARRFPNAPSWAGIGLLMLGAVLLAGEFGLWHPSVIWGFLLIGLGVALFKRDADRERQAADPLPETVGTVPSDAVPEAGSPAAPSSPLWEAPPPRPPRKRRERSPLGWLAFGLALATTGVLWLLRDSGAAHPSIAQLLALPLALLGAGLLVGAVAGRARWTILPGLMLAPAVLLASIITVPLNGRWENRYIYPTTAASLRPTYEQSGANLVFDFTKLQPGEYPGPVHATTGIGEIQVNLPKGMPVSITASAGFGDLNLLRGQRTGLGVTDSVTVPGPHPIVMDLEVGIGTVSVYYQAVPHKHRNGGGKNG